MLDVAILQGMSNAQKRTMYWTTFRQLMWWCALMAVVCSAFLLLLMSTPTWIDPTYGLIKVRHMHLAQLMCYIFLWHEAPIDE